MKWARCSLLLLLSLSVVTTVRAGPPTWWTNVMNPGAITNDFAALNHGQLKWMATNAYDVIDDRLSASGGAGTGLTAVVTSMPGSNNYAVVNLGQLKALAAPFHDRLVERGFRTGYPWTIAVTDDVDYAAANIGQLKHVFDFVLGPDSDIDGDGLSNSVETATGTFVSPEDTGSSPTARDTDGDGVEDGEELASRTDPNNTDRTAPAVTLTVIVPRWALP